MPNQGTLNDLKNNNMVKSLADIFHNYRPKDYKGIKEEIVYEDESEQIVRLWKIIGLEHRYK